MSNYFRPIHSAANGRILSWRPLGAEDVAPANPERSMTAITLYGNANGQGQYRQIPLKPGQQVEMRDLKDSNQWYGSAWLPPNMWLFAFGDINWDKRYAHRYPWNEFSGGASGQLIANLGTGLPAVYHIVMGSQQKQDEYDRLSQIQVLRTEESRAAEDAATAERLRIAAEAAAADLARAQAAAAEREKLRAELTEVQSRIAAEQAGSAEREALLARNNELLKADAALAEQRAQAQAQYEAATGQSSIAKYAVPIAVGVGVLVLVMALR